jgi:hypothetical protein
MFERPPVEKYLRVARPRNHGGTVDVGLEYTTPGDAEVDRVVLREILRRVDDANPEADADTMAELVKAALVDSWPSRAYFIESWFSKAEDDWIQIFQPFGVPRNR